MCYGRFLSCPILLIFFCSGGGGGCGGGGGGDSYHKQDDGGSGGSAEQTEFTFRLYLYKAKLLLLQEQVGWGRGGFGGAMGFKNEWFDYLIDVTGVVDVFGLLADWLIG